jgi:hypothetical protein
MFHWYRDAAVCYAYLSDVETKDEIVPMSGSVGSFASSKWFKRGWTLQELLAPANVIFYDAHWNQIGSKAELCEDLSIITGIPSDALLYTKKLNAFSIADRMSWAHNRSTTREEDLAYCLLGIFDIHMPLLYGEGRKAFIRLQEEILKTSNDQSIFAWAMPENSLYMRWGLLAPSPAHFALTRNLQLPSLQSVKPFSITNRGLRITLPLARLDEDDELWQAVYRYKSPSGKQRTFALYLVQLKEHGGRYAQQESSIKSRCFARVCTNFIDCSDNWGSVRQETVYVTISADTLNHTPVSSVSMQVRDLVNGKQQNKDWFRTTRLASPTEDNNNCLAYSPVVKGPLYKSKVLSDQSLNPNDLHLLSTQSMGRILCVSNGCGASFVRSVDFKIHRLFCHTRHGIRTPSKDGGFHFIKQAELNAGTTAELGAEAQGDEILEW